MNIVLDIDGTLIEETPSSMKESRINHRPHLHTFLAFCFDNFDTVSIWTAASEEWANEVISSFGLDKKFAYVYTGKNTTTEQKIVCSDECRPYFGRSKVKPLKKLWKRKDTPIPSTIQS